MDNIFPITVIINNKNAIYNVQLVTIDYTHRFILTLNEVQIIYEPDEERKYRAIVPNDNIQSFKNADLAIIEAVGDKLNAIHN